MKGMPQNKQQMITGYDQNDTDILYMHILKYVSKERFNLFQESWIINYFTRKIISPMQTILYLSFPLSHVAGTKLCENIVHRRELD